MPLPGALTISSSSVYFGFHPSSAPIFAAHATNTAGSPGPPRRFLDRNRMPSHPASRLYHFPHGEATSVSQVVDQPVALFERLESQQMRLGEILDVDVVANARAVRVG